VISSKVEAASSNEAACFWVRLAKSSLPLDISDEAVRKCGEKGFKAEVFDASTGMLPFKDGEFDCAVMLDVLEHLYSPENLLAEAKRVSREYLVISVPNFNSLPARVQVLRGDVPENNKRGKHHFFWFNYKILKGLLYENQLKIIAIKTNTFWENKFIFKYLMKFFSKFFPSLFALSFVVKVVKTE